MVEYKVVPTYNLLSHSAVEGKLNDLAKDDWVVVCTIGSEAIIMERITDEGKLLAEEVLRNQFTYSLPGMETQDDE